ncbi:SDR family NAD(P)-dependent oxidoreductase [Pseudonocardia acidicola]|uniref:SDR family oxidoreductase n=1 Tax=Pseudonocardia acidicola TaxID=2724939 RepID=A0ABX1S7K2_9PSEU|nr:SDR family oxidoreductase [Pseudonocardia acidicola]NMH96229.1 SDR family oxidoreductase [Pseudonocardia acidicola]
MTDRLFDLSGSVALVTGGSRGLGRQMVLGFAERGADVIVVSRKQDACEKVAAEAEAAFGVRAWALAANVSHWDQCDDLVKRAYAAAGHVDVLVNNAGLSPLYPSLEDVSEALYDKVFAVNLKGPFRLGSLVGARMAAAGSGCIINISSVESAIPSPTALPYAAAKSGLETLTRGLARAYAPAVRVNTITAGPFLTDISDAWDMDAVQAGLQRSMALQRAGRPEEIVGAAVYLASPSASFTTGATVRVDGGTYGSLF